jgi:tetratricopeptide (TPR) repeat protein
MNLIYGLTAAGKLDAAEEYARKAVAWARAEVETTTELSGDRTQLANALVSLSNVLVARGQTKDASKILKESLESFDQSDGCLLGIYTKLLYLSGRMKDHEAALKYMNRYIEIDPTCPTAYYNRGHTLLNLERLDEAYRSFEKSVEMVPKFGMAHFWLGFIRSRQEEHEAAVQHFSKAIELGHLRPLRENIWVRGGRGRSLLILGRYDEALSDLTSVTELQGTTGEANPNLAWLLAAGPESVRNPNRALEMATQSIKPPKQSEILGAAYYRMGRYADAVRAFSEALEHEDQIGFPGQVRLLLAMARWQLGEREEAQRCLRHAQTWIEDNAVPEDVHLRDIQREAANLFDRTKADELPVAYKSGRRVPTAK